MDEKRLLNRETRKHYYFLTVKRGMLAVLDATNARIRVFLCLLVWIVGCELWEQASPVYVYGLLHTCQLILTPFAICCAFYWAGYIPGSWEIYKNLVRISLVNEAGEAPYLVSRKNVGEQTEYIFQSRGITASEWHRRLEEIQSAINLTIGSIKPSTDYRTLTIRTVPPNMVFGQTIMWDRTLINLEDDADFVLGKTAAGEIVRWNCETMPHMLIGGATSSGKSRISMLILEQAILRDADVSIIDLKGLDYRPLEAMDACLVTDMSGAEALLEKTVRTMYTRRDLLRDADAANYQEYNKKVSENRLRRIFILVDECSMLTNSGVSKEAKAASQGCIDRMTTLVRLGRAVGIHLLIATQVPDVSSVPTAIRANLDMRVCGKADSILSTMVLGDGRADELIPKDARGRFVVANGAESVVFQAFYYAT